MASETTALDILQRQVESLTAQLQSLTSERNEYRDALTEISEERDTLKTKVAAPDAQAARIAELEASIRDRNHFDKFTELAKGAKAKEAALKHLWQVSGYKAEADEPDEKALGKLVAELRQKADYAFDPEDNGTITAAREGAKARSGLELRETPAPAGGGRSNRNMGGDGTIITAEMRADPKFMLDPRNREIIASAAREHRFR
jgi:chromosome segregation ATPase